MGTIREKLKKEIIEIAQQCGSQGWCPLNSGNLSVITRDRDRVYIKVSGADMSKLTYKDILTVDMEGTVLEGTGRPSIEVNLHLGTYQVRPDVRAVVHVHPPYATAYATAGKKMPLVLEIAEIVLSDVPLLQFAPAGSIGLARNVTSTLRDVNVKAVLLQKHGVVAVGETLEKAYYRVACVEENAKIAFLQSLITNSRE